MHLPGPGTSFDAVPRCGPPPPCQVLSPSRRCRHPRLQASQPVPAGNDCKSTLLFELPLRPLHRSPPAWGSGTLSQQPPRAGTEPGSHRAGGRRLPRGCVRPGSYVCARVCIRVCVRERVCVSVRAKGVSSAPGALGGELQAKPEPAALRGAGRLHSCVNVAVAAAAAL